MSNSSLQLTIRGIDPDTKAALVEEAHNKRVSVNHIVVSMLEKAFGTSSKKKDTVQEMREYWREHRIPHEDIVAAEEAIRWHKQASLEKQRRDIENGVFGA